MLIKGATGRIFPRYIQSVTVEAEVGCVLAKLRTLSKLTMVIQKNIYWSLLVSRVQFHQVSSYISMYPVKKGSGRYSDHCIFAPGWIDDSYRHSSGGVSRQWAVINEEHMGNNLTKWHVWNTTPFRHHSEGRWTGALSKTKLLFDSNLSRLVYIKAFVVL